MRSPREPKPEPTCADDFATAGQLPITEFPLVPKNRKPLPPRRPFCLHGMLPNLAACAVAAAAVGNGKPANFGGSPCLRLCYTSETLEDGRTEVAARSDVFSSGSCATASDKVFQRANRCALLSF